MKPLFYALVWVLAGALLGGLLYVLFLSQPVPAGPEAPIIPPQQNQTPPPPETPKRAEVNITFIEAPDCDACNYGGFLLQQAKTVILQSKNLTIGSEETIQPESPRAQGLISQYGITELPSLLISGNVMGDPEFVSAWEGQVGSLEDNDTLVTRLRYPPFYDVGNRSVVGLVRAVAIRASNCPQCEDPSMFLAALEGQGFEMAFSDKTVYYENDTEARALISKYNITRLPTFLIDAEGASAYPVFPEIEPLFSSEDGWYIYRNVSPPYLDLAANHSIIGLVHAVVIEAPGCAACFNASEFSAYIADASGIVIGNETSLDPSSDEAKAIIAKYEIGRIPSVLYSPDAGLYPGFSEAWGYLNNTVESDGWFVFRAYDDLNLTYTSVSG